VRRGAWQCTPDSAQTTGGGCPLAFDAGHIAMCPYMSDAGQAIACRCWLLPVRDARATKEKMVRQGGPVKS